MTANPRTFNIKTFNIKTSNIMTSNIEPLAREMAERICRRSGMPEADIPRWVDLHWPCAAAMLMIEAAATPGARTWKCRPSRARPPFRWTSRPMKALVDLADKEAVYAALDSDLS